jgi:prepilin peptidase CpaA
MPRRGDLVEPATLKLLYLAIVTAVVTVAAVIDFRFWKIPNWLSVSLAAAGVVVRLALESDRWEAFKDMGLGFVIGFGILFVLWLIAGGGAGDVKLMGAVGIWVGTKIGLVFIATAVVVVLIEAVRFVKRLIAPSPKDRTAGTLEMFKGKSNKRRLGLPYAVPLAIVCWIWLALMVMKVTMNPTG